MVNMVDVRIIWPPVKPKVANQPHTVRDLMEWGEWQRIMVSMLRVKGNVCGWENMEEQSSINSSLEESKVPNKALFLFLLLPSLHLCAFTMSCLWRAQNQARGPNRGESHNEASPTTMNDSTPSRGGESIEKPFNWGDQYMAETPTAIEAFIAILEIDLLWEFEAMMGRPLLPNPFWTAHILLVWDIQEKI